MRRCLWRSYGRGSTRGLSSHHPCKSATVEIQRFSKVRPVFDRCNWNARRRVDFLHCFLRGMRLEKVHVVLRLPYFSSQDITFETFSTKTQRKHCSSGQAAHMGEQTGQNVVYSTFEVRARKYLVNFDHGYLDFSTRGASDNFNPFSDTYTTRQHLRNWMLGNSGSVFRIPQDIR